MSHQVSPAEQVGIAPHSQETYAEKLAQRLKELEDQHKHHTMLLERRIAKIKRRVKNSVK